MKNADYGFKCRKAFLAETARSVGARLFSAGLGIIICGSITGAMLAARG
jgi:predicted Rossmann-fold nucleotide-binding protein